MRAVPVVPMQPERQMAGARVRSSLGAGVGPFTQCGLEEALSRAVGARGVGLGVAQFDAQASAQTAKAPGLVTGAVVGQPALDADAEACVLAHGTGTAGALIGIEGAEGDARGVIHSDVKRLPAGALGAALGPLTAHSMSRHSEAAELLAIQVQEGARLGVRIALHRRGRGARVERRLSPRRRRMRLTVLRPMPSDWPMWR